MSYTTKPRSDKRSGPDAREREEMIVSLAPLVRRIASRMALRVPSSVSVDELVSAGCVGLIEAVDKFDPSKGVELKTFAEHRIRGAILDELRGMDWYSRSMRKKIQAVEQAVMRVESRHGRTAEDWEIAEELELPIEEYFDLLTRIHGAALLSLDEPIRDGENGSANRTSHADRLQSNDDPGENLARVEVKQVVAGAVRGLTEKERIVISLYYYDELTLKEIGTVLSLTESRICQIHTLALIKLKNRLREYFSRKKT